MSCKKFPAILVFLAILLLLQGCAVPTTTVQAPDTSQTDTPDETEAGSETEAPAVFVTETLKVMGYNLDANMDTYAKRRDGMIGIFNKYMPDSIGLQEVRPGWMTYLRKKFSGYDFVGVNANGLAPDDRGYNSDQALSTFIFYNTERLEVIDSGTFWLSRTPDVPSIYSNTVDCFRTCNYAIFRVKESGLVYAHFNAHLDWMDVKATDYQISLIRDRMADLIELGIPVFATGDYNTDEGTSTYRLMLENEKIGDAKFLTSDSMDIGTYPSYGSYDVNVTEPIDFCFVSKDLVTVNKYRVVDDMPEGKYVSDHYGIYVEAECTEELGLWDDIPAPKLDGLSPEVNVSGSTVSIAFENAESRLPVNYYTVTVENAQGGETVALRVSSKYSYSPMPDRVEASFAPEASGNYTVSITAVTVGGKTSGAVTAEFSYEKRDIAHLEADIFDLEISADSVRDASVAGLEIRPASGGAPKIVKDGDNFVILCDGSEKGYSAYGIKDHYSTMAKGFTAEIYALFEETDEYTNIFSNYHAGGFGFDVEKGGLYFGLRIDDAYVTTAPYAIKKNEYCHAVAAYDGNVLSIYINGQLHDSIEAGSNVSFASLEGAMYLSIGCDSDATGKGEYFASGKLAAARIYSYPVSASDAAEMYAKFN